MNAVMQSSTHPMVVMERNMFITNDLLDLLSAYTGSTFQVSDLHRCQVRQILLQMDSVKTMLLNRMDGHPITDGEGNIQTAMPKMAAAVARAG